MLSRDGHALMGLVGSSRLRRTGVSFDSHEVADAVVVAGRLPFPRPPRSFRSPGDPRGFPTAPPSSGPHLAMRIRVPAFLVFAPLQSNMLSPGRFPDLLSWDWSGPSHLVDIPVRHLLVRATPPLHRHALWRPLPLRCRHRSFGSRSARSEPCSDPVVSHHLAGLRCHSPRHRGCRETTLSGNHAESRGLVASRCQSWGSSRFRSDVPVARCVRHSRDAVLPLEGFPPSSAVPCHHGLLPS
jgi:hypothetical protein